MKRKIMILAILIFALSFTACSNKVEITDEMVKEKYSLAEVISLYDKEELIDYIRLNFSANDIWDDIDSHVYSGFEDHEPQPEDVDPEALWDYFEEQMEKQAEMERDQQEFFGY